MSGLGRFEGKVALVTGASRGIGLAIAERLISEGAKVCITGRKQEALDAAVESLGGAGACIGSAGSADDEAHQDATIELIAQRFGRLDALVNNTGINPAYGKLLDADRGAMRKMVDVNMIAGLDWVGKALPAGLREGGAVVNVASVAGLRTAEGIGFYGATKAAVMHLTQQLSVELAPEVRVNAVAPAVVRTRFAGALFEGREEEVIARYPAGRLGLPEDIAAAVAYLASGDAAWVTGQTLVIDGGLTQGGGI